MIKLIRILRKMVQIGFDPARVMSEVAWIDQHHREIGHIKRLLRERNVAHLDVSAASREPNTIIAIGRHRGREFIQTYRFTDGEFDHLVRTMRELTRHSRLGIIDGPPQMRAVLKSMGVE